MRLSGTARNVLVVLLLALVLIPFGVPRFLTSDDDSPAGARDDVRFAKVCREHGGTPGAGANSESQRVCRVRYGAHVYLMDAITPDGFDADTAKFQRQGCAEARRQAQASAGSGQPRETFVYHPKTGICEKRP